MDRKYKLIRRKENGKTVTRIKALRDGKYFKKGEIGATVDENSELSQIDDGWADDRSELHNSKIHGDISIRNSIVRNSVLSEVRGRIQNSLLVNASANLSELRISDSNFIGELHGDCTLGLEADQASFDCSVVLSGFVILRGTKMHGFDAAVLPVKLSDVNLQHATFNSPATVTDSFIFRSDFEGVMAIDQSHIQNSRLVTCCGNSPEHFAPQIHCLAMVGSQVRVPDGREYVFSTGVTLSDLTDVDLATLRWMTAGKFVVVRVPGRKWFIQPTATPSLFDDEHMHGTEPTTAELCRTLSGVRGLDATSEAAGLLRTCLILSEGESGKAERKQMRRLYWKLVLRRIAGRLSAMLHFC